MGHHTLYDRLGGTPAVVAVIDDFVGRAAADIRINAKFARTDVPRLKAMLVEQVCAATGGPVTYTGRGSLWILDVNSVRVVLETMDYAGTSAARLAELKTIVESVQIDR